MEKETKKERFNRLKDARMGKFLHMMRLFQHFTNTQVYEYTDEQVKEIIDTMRREVDVLEDTLYHREIRSFKLQ
jgi:hypothetical protein